MAREVEMISVEGKLPLLMKGDDDAMLPGWNHVGRMQALINYQLGADTVDVDGVYGSKTASALNKIMVGGNPTGKNGTKCGEPEWRRLVGLSK